MQVSLAIVVLSKRNTPTGNIMNSLTNLEKRDLSQADAFTVYPKIEAAYEAGDFEEAVNLNETYERLTANAIMWEQKELNA